MRVWIPVCRTPSKAPCKISCLHMCRTSMQEHRPGDEWLGEPFMHQKGSSVYRAEAAKRLLHMCKENSAAACAMQLLTCAMLPLCMPSQPAPTHAAQPTQHRATIACTVQAPAYNQQ